MLSLGTFSSFAKVIYLNQLFVWWDVVHKYCNESNAQQFPQKSWIKHATLYRKISSSRKRSPSNAAEVKVSKRMSNDFKSDTRNTIMKRLRASSFSPERHPVNQFYFNCISFFHHTQTFKSFQGVDMGITEGGEQTLQFIPKWENKKSFGTLWKTPKAKLTFSFNSGCFSRERV